MRHNAPIMPLTPQELAWYMIAVQAFDPDNEIVKIDISAESNVVIYSNKIISDENNTRPITPEEIVHATIATILCGKDYKYLPENLIHERRIRHGSKGSASDEIDFILNDLDGNPFAIFEVKSSVEADSEKEDAIKWQLFGTAVLLPSTPKFLVFATVHPVDPKTMDVIVIDYAQNKNYDEWVSEGRPSFDKFPRDYQLPDYEPYTNGGTRDLDTNVSQSDLKTIAQSIHNQFFSEHPDNQLYVNIVKIMLAKIHDELTTRKGAEYNVQIKLKNGKEQSAREVFDNVNDLYKSAYRIRIDKNGEDDIKPDEFSPDRVKSIVRMIAGISLTRRDNKHGDFIGTFFEEILRDGFRQDRGMYFTHSNLVDFMVRGVDLEGLVLEKWEKADHPDHYMPYIIDPACGSGAFLLRSMEMATSIVNNNKSRLTDTVEGHRFYGSNFNEGTPNGWAAKFIYGFDPKFIMAVTCKVNMVLHGDGSAHIFKDDAFKSLSLYKDSCLTPSSEAMRSIPKSNYRPDVSEKFDLVISNPPFGITLQNDILLKADENFTLGMNTSSESLFIERSFQLLKPNGRLAIVIPESLLNSPDNFSTRLLILRLFKLKSVVSLPRNIFIDTPTLTSIIFAQRKTGSEIIEWDKEFNNLSASIDATILMLKAFMSRALRKNSSITSVQVFEKAKEILPKILGEVSWFVKGGKSSELIKLYDAEYQKLDVSEIVNRYREIMKLSGFRDVVEIHLLNMMNASFFTDYYAYTAEEVGYKLSKRKEKEKPNDLAIYRDSVEGSRVTNLNLSRGKVEVVSSLNEQDSILDSMKANITWEALE